ncbi:MAG: thiamine phosphate synthase [Candidatus Methanoplasma sp.]|jgi:thiamine-phosphate pyrophosphorylase|nr:thiamine phosphate synthase [Candidatus Methanoplasma sp.]
MLIAATDRKISMLPFAEQIRLIAEAGPDMIILSERDLSPEDYKALASSCMEVCRRNNVIFAADKFAAEAKEIGADALFIDLEELRSSKPEGFDTVLTTIRSEREAVEAEKLGADILIFRDVFDLTCKSCRNAKGLATLRYVLGSVDIPIVGAGGIMPDVFAEVLASDAAGICMREGFMRTKNPSAIVAAYREAETRIKGAR